MRRNVWTIGAASGIVAAALLTGCSSAPKTPSNEDLAKQIETAYVPAKACWNSFRNSACPDVMATAWEKMQPTYKELQSQGREKSVQELAAVHTRWTKWLASCIDDYPYASNTMYCIQESPGGADMKTAADLIRQGQ
jgi:hypothetical protein